MWPFKSKEEKEEKKEERRNKAEEQQKKHAQYLCFDKRYREVLTLAGGALINDYIPKQTDGEFKAKLTTNVVNVMMPDYDGKIKKEGVLAGMEKDFLPQPGMLEYWAKSKGFEEVKADGNRLKEEDVAGKYVLTYYTQLAKSWAKRTTDDINDTTNKHWYSHCKSAIYDDKADAIATSNPELFYNDTEHTQTKYVPEDSFSYVIDYKKLGLDEKHIKEGFLYQQEGINIMDKKMQDAIFQMNKLGLTQEDVIGLWKQQVDLTNADNLETITKHMQNGGNKEEIGNYEFVKSDNQYKYNFQDKSCAIQPTAPILYATAAKINEENLGPAEANKLRQDIGLYNIYDPQNYGTINESFYKQYSNDTILGAKAALSEDIKEFMKHPIKNGAEFVKNTYHTASWASAKTKLLFPEMLAVMQDITNRKEKNNTNAVSNTKDQNTQITNLTLAYSNKQETR